MAAHKDVFVLGPDRPNMDALRAADALADCTLHSLLDADDLVHVDTIDFEGLLAAAERQLAEHDGPVDAIVGYWDFPVSTMVPILSERRGLRSTGLESLFKCEHKYWSRLEQRKAISDLPRFGTVDLASGSGPPPDVDFPMWIKPVKSFSSQLAFRVEDEQGLQEAISKIRAGIDRIGAPFDAALRHASLPAEISEIGGEACLVEEAVGGRQVTVEGYSYDGDVHCYGLIDTVNYSDSPSFLHYQYPSGLPGEVCERIYETARRVVAQVGLTSVPFNIEFFWDEQHDRLNLLEINPRHSQSHAGLFQAVDGAPNHQILVELALGREPRMPHRRGEHAVAGKYFLRRFVDGTALRVPTSSEVAAIEQELPGTRIELRVGEGTRLSELPDQDSYSYELAHIYIGARDEQEMRRKYDRCADALRFEFEDAGGSA